jgi:hypothetical protein
MLQRMAVPVLVVVVAAMLSACSDTTATCPPRVPLPAVDVEIREAGTDLPLAAAARGAVRDGAYTDSLQPGRSDGGVLVSRRAAFERPGIYTVEIVAPGYAMWQRTGVVALEGACGVVSATLLAILEPTS